MALTSVPTVATGDTIEAATQNTMRDNDLVLDGRTGADPGGASKWLVSSSSTVAAWIARLTALADAFASGTVSSALTISGALSAASANLTGGLTALSAGIGASGLTNAGQTILSAALTGTSAAFSGAISAASAALSGGLSAQSVTSSSHVQGTRMISTVNDGSTVPIVVQAGQAAVTCTNLRAATAANADNAALLDSLDSTAFALVATGVPNGAIVAFETLAELTAAGAAWQRYTAADGRLLIGAGVTGGATWTQATDYGTSWSHTHTGPAHTHASTGLTATSAAINPTADPSVNITGGAGVAAIQAHTHPAPAITMGGSTASSGTGATSAEQALPYMRGVIWGKKIP
jgi:hypothetical protein